MEKSTTSAEESDSSTSYNIAYLSVRHDLKFAWFNPPVIHQYKAMHGCSACINEEDV